MRRTIATLTLILCASLTAEALEAAAPAEPLSPSPQDVRNERKPEWWAFWKRARIRHRGYRPSSPGGGGSAPAPRPAPRPAPKKGGASPKKGNGDGPPPGSPTPEPGTLALLALAGGGAWLGRRRRRRR